MLAHAEQEAESQVGILPQSGRSVCTHSQPCLLSGAKSFKALEPKGYCSDWRYVSTGTQDGGYDDKSKTAGECMKRCMAKLPGTTSFFLMGTKCGCSATTTGKCKITANNGYVSYEIVDAGTMCPNFVLP